MYVLYSQIFSLVDYFEVCMHQAMVDCGLFWNVYTSGNGVLYLLWVILEHVHIKQWLVISLVGYFENVYTSSNGRWSLLQVKQWLIISLVGHFGICEHQAMVGYFSYGIFWNMFISNNSRLSLAGYFGTCSYQTIGNFVPCEWFLNIYTSSNGGLSLVSYFEMCTHQAVVDYLSCGLFWNMFISSNGGLSLLWAILKHARIK